MPKFLTAALLGVVALSTQAAAQPVVNCPLRDAPFSVDIPFIDLMLSEKAKETLAAQIPGFFEKLPPAAMATDTPIITAILNMRLMIVASGNKDIDEKKLDAALRALPVTDADKKARCARYDDERPVFSELKGKVRVLLFDKSTGFRDAPSVEAANKMVRELAEQNNWALVVTDKAGAMRPDILKQFDTVMWNNVSGDVLTLTQRKAFEDYIEGGGGFVGIHGSGGDPIYFWDWYPDKLIGARFVGHPSDPHFQDAKITVEQHPDGLGAGFEPGWSMSDEWYSFAASPRLTGAHVIATIDEKSYRPAGANGSEQHLVMGDDHPIAWSRNVGKGRSFYSAIGHRPETYSDPRYRKLLVQAITWTSGKKVSD
jgi:type 1 glutamine amidotransferase